MDVNGDGRIDILSGCYSRLEGSMAGLFWVLPGLEGGGFGAAEALLGTDGAPLILTGDNDPIDRICTRPTAIDWDGDGDLDIVSGCFEGTFSVFLGEGGGKFAPTCTPLTDGKDPIRVTGAHSDPVFVDWDGDGDLDLVSGGTDGVFLFRNRGGSPPTYGKRETLLEAEHSGMQLGDDVVFGDAHITTPQSDFRVFVDDLDGDGRFDLLIGDNSYVTRPAKGLTEEEARRRLADWNRRMDALMERMEPSDDGSMDLGDEFDELYRERAEFLEEGGVGTVWVMRQKAPEPATRDV
ncbi:MAG: VCBS repeat-containing protein [Planctomycetota bacterium]